MDIVSEPLEVKIIFSGSPNDPPHLKEHNTTKAEQNQIIRGFKKPLQETKLAFLIVKDMLLTGFDAPIEQVMYLDRPLKEHNLLQAIARVNRTCGDRKKCGYVVYYYGVSNFLEEALAIFDQEELGKPMESLNSVSVFQQMLSYREAVMGIFKGLIPTTWINWSSGSNRRTNGPNLNWHINGLLRLWNNCCRAGFPPSTSMICDGFPISGQRQRSALNLTKNWTFPIAGKKSKSSFRTIFKQRACNSGLNR